MKHDVLKLYERASDWTLSKVIGAAKKLDSPTPCDKWNVRELMNHMLETQRYFINSAQGIDASPPGPLPPALLSDDPVADFQQTRSETISAFSRDGVIKKSGPTLGIALSDQLLHGWDLARATGQDATIPKDLAEAAYKTIRGRFTDEQRKGVFQPEVTIPPRSSAQDKLLAYSGRIPAE